MHLRALLPLALVLLVPISQAQLVTYRVSGAVSESETSDGGGAPLDPSPVETEFSAGTPIELTFSYDAGAPVAQTFGANEALYDAPFAVTGRIGTRTFSANASLIDVVDNTGTFPGGAGDLLQFRIDPLFSRDFTTVTDANIIEDNPFQNTALRLDYFFVQFARTGGGAFAGTGLPPSIDLATYDSNLFFFDYFDGANTETTVLGSVASVTPVPEPATLAALGLGAAALLRRRRKA